MQDPDIELVKKAQKKDKRAFGQLVDKYYQMVYAVAYGVLNQREEAQDAANEVFLKVYNTLEKFQGQSKFKTWLYRVTVNASIDIVRKRKPTVPLENIDIKEAPRHGPRANASREELKALVREGLKHLSEDHRAVLVLREWEHLSYDEIAESLKIEVGTVMSRLHYAKKN